MNISKFVQLVGNTYASDPTRASVTMSHLDNGMAYVSIVRYSKPFAGGKSIVAKAVAPTLDGAIAIVLKAWLQKIDEGTVAA